MPLPEPPADTDPDAWLALARADGRIGFWRRSGGHWVLDAVAARLWDLPAGTTHASISVLRERVVEADRAAFDGDAEVVTLVLAAHDGLRRVLLRRRTLADGRLVGTVAEAPPLPAAAESAESQLALAVELGNIAIWRHDLATDRIHYNDQAYRALGIAPRPEGLALAEVRALIHPDDLPRVLASAETALQRDRPADMEARYRSADGRWRDVMTRRVVQRDAAGRAIAFVGVALDVTERLAQQRRAEEATRRFELVTRTAGIGYWTHDGHDERATWNPTLRALMGLAGGDPVPRLREWIETMIHPGDRELVRERWVHWIRTGGESLDLVFRIVRRDGQVRQVISHSRLESRPPERVLFGVAIDVTDRQRVEHALRSARERAQLAARAAGIATWELDLRDGTAYWDEQMWVLRGHPPQPGAMAPDERLACLHPEDRERTRRLITEATASGAPLDHEFRVVWPGGQVRWLASRSIEVRDEGGARRIGVNWDVTDRRSAEEARREREVALRESRAKSEFLARMSHELRTPLNAVLGFAQLLLAEDRGDDAQAQQRRRRVDHIRAAGQHLLSLINDVLDLARLERGDVRIALEAIALAPLVAQTLPLVQPQADRQRVTIHCRVEPLDVQADATRLRQVLLNLLSSAVKYNREGGRVELEAAAAGDEVLLSVSDAGGGLSAPQLRRLVEPFDRLGADGEAIEGTGIGLAITRLLVERMGGRIAVSSEPGRGSRFEVRLRAARAARAPQDADRAPAAAAPRADGHAPAMPAAASAGVGSNGRAGPSRHRLLYIEDNPVNALIIRELVARRGDIELTVAGDGASGVAEAAALEPELILLDMQLPDFDGFEVMRRLRANPANARTPVIALSANAMPEDIRCALAAGLADYWTKPLDFAAFMANLESLFGKPLAG
jgi:PAS domain S-box-containing protein